jgi:3-isopropylmalate/(R)-2-methylmalate dehydratase small subunit
MLEQIIRGKVFPFGKNIDTDQIYPGRFVELTDTADVARHAMEGADPEFARLFSHGDIIVAASNFGCGSSREHAAITLKSVGAGAVIADSFGRIFYRNAVNIGLPVLVCKGLRDRVNKGDIISVRMDTGRVLNAGGETLGLLEPVSDYLLNILRAGGIKPLLRKQLASEKFA